MTEIERICDQFRRVFDGNAWHGPSVMTLLEGVSASQAASHPIPNAHSIWQLVNHISAWESACLRRLNGDPAQLTDEEDWPAVTDTSEDAWEKTKAELVSKHNELLNAVAAIDEGRLNESIINHPSIPFSSVYVTLHGGIQHDDYHAGQIAIVKKALS